LIGLLAGDVLECLPDRVLLGVAGVGYLVHIPLSTYYVLAAAGGQRATLHVHTHVREDALQLFGFASRDERAAFEQLIAISGVGPRTALAVLSGIGVEELREAVASSDRARLQKIPGIGRKTAERMLLELRDRLGDIPREGATGRVAGQLGRAEPSLAADGVSALVNLGYSQETARRAVSIAVEREAGQPTLERVLKRALKELVP
jgi:Holliday junction DNA helicase RuvA